MKLFGSFHITPEPGQWKGPTDCPQLFWSQSLFLSKGGNISQEVVVDLDLFIKHANLTAYVSVSVLVSLTMILLVEM